MEVKNRTPLRFSAVFGQIRYPETSLTCVLKGTFVLAPDRPAAFAPPDRASPIGEATQRGDGPDTRYRYPSDLAPHKPCGEIIAKAIAYAPGGQPVDRIEATLEVIDKISKTLVAVGPRFWVGDAAGELVATEAPPVAEMPIRWENAFGGTGFAANPVGRGIDRTSSTRGPEWRLPKVEYPDDPVESPGQTVLPACFGPVEADWEPRRSQYGTADAEWERTRSPWYPADLDWAYFNEAAADQRLPPKTFFAGDEWLRFVNLHPEMPEFRAQLPCRRPRCFVIGRYQGSRFELEVPLRLDTLWCCPDELALQLVWRGAFQVEDRDRHDIEHILIGCEPLANDPLPIELYKKRYFGDPDGTVKAAAAVKAELDKAEAAALKQLDDALAAVAEADLHPDIKAAFAGDQDPLAMLTNVKSALVKLADEAGIELPPDVR